MYRNNDTISAFIGGLIAGATIMYFLDPDRGARRRSLVRDKAVALKNDATDAISTAAEDLSNRAYGTVAEATKAVTGTPIDELGSDENAREEKGRSATGGI